LSFWLSLVAVAVGLVMAQLTTVVAVVLVDIVHR
jgi:hypothetical protein